MKIFGPFLLRTTLAFLVCWLLSAPLTGQGSSIDTLILRMEQTVEPVEKIDLLVQIIELYRDTDTKRAMQYANWALRESENSGRPRRLGRDSGGGRLAHA